MLEVAHKRGMYHRLVLADTSEPFEVGGSPFEFVIAAGVFLEGRCGPGCILHLLTHLRNGGYACITVRLKSFEAAKVDYMEMSHCVIVENTVQEYLSGHVDANYIVLRKKMRGES